MSRKRASSAGKYQNRSKLSHAATRPPEERRRAPAFLLVVAAPKSNDGVDWRCRICRRWRLNPGKRDLGSEASPACPFPSTPATNIELMSFELPRIWTRSLSLVLGSWGTAMRGLGG
jgi:hypothetical protein